MRAARDRRMLAAKRPRTGDEHERVVARSQVVARRFRTIFCRSHSNTRCVTHFTKQYQVGVGARVVHTLSTFCTARARARGTSSRGPQPASTFNRGVVGAVRRPSRDKLQVQRLKRWSRASKHEGRRTANAHRPRTARAPPAHRPSRGARFRSPPAVSRDYIASPWFATLPACSARPAPDRPTGRLDRPARARAQGCGFKIETLFCVMT